MQLAVGSETLHLPLEDLRVRIYWILFLLLPSAYASNSFFADLPPYETQITGNCYELSGLHSVEAELIHLGRLPKGGSLSLTLATIDYLLDISDEELAARMLDSDGLHASPIFGGNLGHFLKHFIEGRTAYKALPDEKKRFEFLVTWINTFSEKFKAEKRIDPAFRYALTCARLGLLPQLEAVSLDGLESRNWVLQDEKLNQLPVLTNLKNILEYEKLGVDVYLSALGSPPLKEMARLNAHAFVKRVDVAKLKELYVEALHAARLRSDYTREYYLNILKSYQSSWNFLLIHAPAIVDRISNGQSTILKEYRHLESTFSKETPKLLAWINDRMNEEHLLAVGSRQEDVYVRFPQNPGQNKKFTNEGFHAFNILAPIHPEEPMFQVSNTVSSQLLGVYVPVNAVSEFISLSIVGTADDLSGISAPSDSFVESI